MFNQWVDGQPWWLTLLLLPALVLAALAVRAVRYGLIVAAVAALAIAAGVAWAWRRRK